jgi:DNA-binding MarR family transcriptional regulator
VPLEPEARATYLIGRIDRIVRRRLDEILEPFDLTLAQYTALSVLASRPGLTNAQLARRSLISPQGMNQALGALADKGLIQRQQHAVNGRQLEVHLTTKGKRLLSRAHRRTEEVDQGLLDRLEPDDRQGFLQMLRILAEPEPGPT